MLGCALEGRTTAVGQGVAEAECLAAVFALGERGIDGELLLFMA
jgi:hypothetical protein